MNEVIGGKVNVLEKDVVEIGAKGRTITYLRPNGKALFGKKKLEVYSLGEYIEKDTSIEVIKVSSSKIFVKPIIKN